MQAQLTVEFGVGVGVVGRRIGLVSAGAIHHGLSVLLAFLTVLLWGWGSLPLCRGQAGAEGNIGPARRVTFFPRRDGDGRTRAVNAGMVVKGIDARWRRVGMLHGSTERAAVDGGADKAR